LVLSVHAAPVQAAEGSELADQVVEALDRVCSGSHVG
jgi:hypothetical protein